MLMAAKPTKPPRKPFYKRFAFWMPVLATGICFVRAYLGDGKVTPEEFDLCLTPLELGGLIGGGRAVAAKARGE